ncbi:major surface protein [Neorickettsia risticii str. Illinois]|uniref:Major surface protein n=1 Tax=Neorickettsia risticii (strain Illinois) TaxID=434131 RepID=C6V541_NEORI|nr:SCO family protein [Neorickettsia risticii]ACT69506.1 major surface protein [Neorickettsia risticii str. Illinois]
MINKIGFIFRLLSVALLLGTSYQAKALNKEITTSQIEIGGTFKLTDQNGRQVTNDILKGKYTLVLFGFSRCPHICPGQLALLEKTLDAFPKLQALFITLDPANDTVEVLNKFSRSFHKRILMLTGSNEMIEKVVNDYKVYVAADEDPEKFNHSALMYLMGLDGRYISHIAPRSEDELLAFVDHYTI